MQHVSNKSDINCAAWIHLSDQRDPWGWLQHHWPAVHTALEELTEYDVFEVSHVVMCKTSLFSVY